MTPLEPAPPRSDAPHHDSDASHNDPDALPSVSDAPHNIPDALHNVSDVPHSKPDVSHSVSDVSHNIPDASLNVSDVVHSDSDALDRHADVPVEAVPDTSNADDLPTWEDDENRVTLLLRASFAFVAGSFLLWTQWRSDAASRPAELWSQWLQLAVFANFLIPLGIVYWFFAQSLKTPDWMRDAKHNAWSYGWKFAPLKRHLAFAGVALLVMLPFLWFASRDASARETYSRFLPPTTTARELLVVLGAVTVYLFCWEWFFRGFLLFGMAQGVGAPASVLAQASLFCAAHMGKPPLEVVGAFFGGLILGVVCWREKSFAPAFYTHALVHGVWVLLLR